MNATKIIGVLLIVAGTLGLIYGGFSYTKDRHDVKLGAPAVLAGGKGKSQRARLGRRGRHRRRRRADPVRPQALVPDCVMPDS